jgi:hypothetical protein
MRIVGLNFKNEPIVFSPTLEDGTLLDSIRISIAPKTDSVKWSALARESKRIFAYQEMVKLCDTLDGGADGVISFEQFKEREQKNGSNVDDFLYFNAIKNVVLLIEVDTLDGNDNTVTEQVGFEVLEQWVEDPTLNFVLIQLVGFIGEQSNFLQQKPVGTKKK